jgi:peptidoglycan/xylan/chitin deacetylase (PgdA/CDA1 family)
MKDLDSNSFFSVMYHYVRPAEASNLRSLTTEKFSLQLDYIEKNHGFVTRDDWNKFLESSFKPRGALLTFDDGLKDHIDWVIPELERRDLPLPVHLAHFLLAHYNADELLEEFLPISPPKLLSLNEDAILAYSNQSQDEKEKHFKRFINWSSQRAELYSDLKDLFLKVTNISFSQFTSEWNLNARDLREISIKGFEIGSHTCSHSLLRDLDERQINRELFDSKAILDEVTKTEVQSFCYPYGGERSYKKKIFDTLKRAGSNNAISVDSKCISTNISNSAERFELPRYDCNLFPFGTWERL